MDLLLEVNLRQWMTATPGLLDPKVQRLLKQMYEFARQIQLVGFGPALKNLAGEVAVVSKAIDLTDLIADRLCRGIDASGNSIERKSLQETLYFCTGIAPELLAPQFGKRLETYLALNGSKGLIQVFLSTHLSNLILMDLHDSLQAATPEIFRTRMVAIERLCETAAKLLVRSWAKWPKLTQSSIMSSAQLASEGMSKAINPKKRAVRRSS